MKEAKVIFRFKRESVYNLTAFIVIRNIKEVLNKELTDKEKQVSKKLWRFDKKIKQALEDMMRVLKEDMAEAIKEGRVNVFFEQDGDKTITFEMEGSDEEIERWTAIKMRQKVALKTYLRPVLKVEVIK